MVQEPPPRVLVRGGREGPTHDGAFACCGVLRRVRGVVRFWSGIGVLGPVSAVLAMAVVMVMGARGSWRLVLDAFGPMGKPPLSPPSKTPAASTLWGIEDCQPFAWRAAAVVGGSA